MVIKWRGFNQWKTEKEGKKEKEKERKKMGRARGSLWVDIPAPMIKLGQEECT